jgi:hypothetical protein
MQALRDQIVEQQRAAGVRVIKPPHALAFLDPNLPTLKQNSQQKPRVRWNLKSRVPKAKPTERMLADPHPGT